jgi:hypothetical protein
MDIQQLVELQKVDSGYLQEALLVQPLGRQWRHSF